LRTLVLSRRGRFQNGVSADNLAAALDDPQNLVWLDIQDPTDADAALLREQFGFHPLAIEDATRAHERPKVNAYGVPEEFAEEEPPAAPQAAGSALPAAPEADRSATAADAVHDEAVEESVLIPLELTPEPLTEEAEALIERGYYFVVFYTAAFNHAEDHIEARPVSLFIGANYLVTVHSGAIPHIPATLARWRAPKSPLAHRVSALVHALLDAMVDDYFPLMDQVADRVEDLEDAIFTHFDEGAIETVFRLKKDLLAVRRIVAPERDVLNVLLRRQLPIFATEDVAYLQDVYDHIVRVTDNIDTYRDLLSSALDSYLSLQGNRLNQIMKVLTVASIILMANALITGFYGQNFRFFPDLDLSLGSFWSLILMAATTLALVIYFRRKGWL
jgi:magnesium transporter